ncbi:MAG: hypothetical protein LBF41_02355, partial [Deltaproteobacteria bacterium]|nr:hypothetical protein [Deltaproteobacteria bacterium]
MTDITDMHDVHDRTIKALLLVNGKGKRMFEMGLVSKDDWLANFVLNHFDRNEFINLESDKTKLLLDFVATLCVDPELLSFPPDFDPSATYILTVEIDWKRIFANYFKYSSYFLTLVREYFLKNKLKLFFFVIYGINVNPSEKEQEIASRISSDLLTVRIIYLSQTDRKQLLESVHEKLEKGQLPENLDIVRLAYLPALTDKLNKAKNPGAANKENEKIFCPSAFQDMLICVKIANKFKDIADNVSTLFHKAITLLHWNRLTESQKESIAKESQLMKEYAETFYEWMDRTVNEARLEAKKEAKKEAEKEAEK